MEKEAVAELASAVRDIHLDPAPKKIPPSLPSSSSHRSTLPSRAKGPRRLVSLCLGVVGQYFEDIILDLAEIASAFPPDIKLALLAIARRRKLLNDEVLIALAEHSWELLDISGSDVTDIGLVKVAELCNHLRALDISRCDNITAAGVSEVIRHCRSLEILRCGGCPRSNFTARRCLSFLKPKLVTLEEESWEELDNKDIVNGAQSLRWLVWPDIDEDSKVIQAAEFPRIILNPQPSQMGFHWGQVPVEALGSVALDSAIVEDIDPKTWAFAGAVRRLPVLIPADSNAPELHIAEKFRLAFLDRDARLAPKRAKNERQHRRRAEREYLRSSNDAKSIALASQASKFLRNWS